MSGQPIKLFNFSRAAHGKYVGARAYAIIWANDFLNYIKLVLFGVLNKTQYI